MRLCENPIWHFQCSYQSELQDTPVYYTVDIRAPNYLEACKEFMMDVLLKAPGFVDILKVKVTKIDDETIT